MPQHARNRPACRSCNDFSVVAITTGTRHRDGSRVTLRVTCPTCHGIDRPTSDAFARAGR
ncbi:hypothetical protein [Streptomyces sp. NPDC048639]|uniref:hypothetical protein n=1 Tax=Streptomyces sp. NPDC048639 TaxID=3365581 RepID=UPI003711D334